MDATLAAKKHPLKLMLAPRIGHLFAPPALTTRSHKVDYTCGYCGSADASQAEDDLLIRCISCGSYNETE